MPVLFGKCHFRNYATYFLLPFCLFISLVAVLHAKGIDTTWIHRARVTFPLLAVFLLICLRDRKAGFFTLCASMPLIQLGISMHVLNNSTLNWAAALVSAFFLWKRKTEIPGQKSFFSAMPFLLITGVNFLRSTDPMFAYTQLLGAFCFIALLYCAASDLSNEETAFALFLYILGTLAILLSATLHYDLSRLPRLGAGTALSPNFIGMQCSMAALAGLGMMRLSKSYVLFVPLNAIFAAGMVFTGSRQSLAALLIGGFVGIMMVLYHRRRSVFLATSGLAVLLVMLPVVAFSLQGMGYISLNDIFFQNSSLNGQEFTKERERAIEINSRLHNLAYEIMNSGQNGRVDFHIHNEEEIEDAVDAFLNAHHGTVSLLGDDGQAMDKDELVALVKMVEQGKLNIDSKYKFTDQYSKSFVTLSRDLSSPYAILRDFSGQRVAIYEKGIAAFEKKPFFGYGLGNFPNAAGTTRLDMEIESPGHALTRTEMEMSLKKLTAHSFFLNGLVEFGLLGFLVALIWLTSLGCEFWRSGSPTGIALFAAGITFCLFSRSYLQLSFLMPMCIAAGFSQNREGAEQGAGLVAGSASAEIEA